MRKINYKELIISIMIPLFLGTVTGLVTAPKSDYSSLIKPSFAPAPIIFPIVWTIIYILLGISYYLTNDHLTTKTYEIQLFLNIIWSIIFFTFNLRLLAFLDILLLTYFVSKMIKEMKKINLTAALLNIPYLLWICYASILNFSIYLLNK